MKASDSGKVYGGDKGIVASIEICMMAVTSLNLLSLSIPYSQAAVVSARKAPS